MVSGKQTRPIIGRMNPLLISPGRSTTFPRLAACALAATVLLSACGGGGGSPGATTGSSSSVGTTPTTPGTPGTRTPDAIPANFQTYANLCVKPRSGADPYTGVTYQDRQGTLLDELKFLRGWVDLSYLWYNEIPNNFYMADFSNTLDYFDKLKTPAVTASGKPKDQFHFTYTTAEWSALNTAGQEVGYGLTWSRDSTTAPRAWYASIVEPGSPAAIAGLKRGDRLMTIDGVDFVNTSSASGVDTINAGLFPERSGESHRLTVQRAGANIDVTLTASVVTSASVKNAKVIETATGRVGYLIFDDFNATAEKQLIDAFTMLKSQNVSDLVIDMRYNGGGLLDIAGELGYMIAGPTSKGKTFERLVYNGKTGPDQTIAFHDTAVGFNSPNPARQGQALPYLGLKRVTVLTTSGTCSASESVINGLRGIDVQVDIIGGGTCGKPFGFTPQDNCGTTYFAIQFQGVNAKNFGDYADGFAPTCNVRDDLSHALGDTAETMLAAALNYRNTNTCAPAATALTGVQVSEAQMKLVRPAAKEIAVLPRTR